MCCNLCLPLNVEKAWVYVCIMPEGCLTITVRLHAGDSGTRPRPLESSILHFLSAPRYWCAWPHLFLPSLVVAIASELMPPSSLLCSPSKFWFRVKDWIAVPTLFLPFLLLSAACALWCSKRVGVKPSAPFFRMTPRSYSEPPHIPSALFELFMVSSDLVPWHCRCPWVTVTACYQVGRWRVCLQQQLKNEYVFLSWSRFTFFVKNYYFFSWNIIYYKISVEIFTGKIRRW